MLSPVTSLLVNMGSNNRAQLQCGPCVHIMDLKVGPRLREISAWPSPVGA